MTTLQLHASQLPIDGDPAATTWRVETNDGDLDFTLTAPMLPSLSFGGKMTAELTEVPFSEDDWDNLKSRTLSLRKAAELAVKSGNIRGDFYNPNTKRFVGLFVKR